MNSVWQDTVEFPEFGRLDNDIQTDVLVIGGGIVGILCAHMLNEAGVKCVLTEASRVCGGITKNTTAKLTIQHGLIYDKLIKRFGINAARLYMHANQAALDKYKEMCNKADCDFEIRDSYVYSLYSARKIENELKALTKIGCSADFTSTLPLPFHAAGAVRIKEQAQFNPLKFLLNIAKDLDIYENTVVTELSPDGAVTNSGKISARKIIVATHFPFINKHGSYFVKMYQSRSYVLGLRNAVDVNGMYVDEDEKGLSFRNYGDLLLLGGGSHRTGRSGGSFKELEDFTKRYYPDASIEYKWATQDCMTLDGIPYIGQYSPNTPDLYVAAGFNKWGMTGAMAAAMILTDMVQGKKNEYAQVFSPSRTIIRPQLAVNAFETITNLIMPTTPRCPHMGCALKYNRAEHSWDCPCHGSRFTKKGKLIDNPATGDMKCK